MVDGPSRTDRRGAPVDGFYGDELGLFEGLEGFLAVVFVQVGKEDPVVRDGAVIGRRKLFDEVPCLLASPVPLTRVDFEKVEFEDLGGGLFDNEVDGVCGS